MDMKALAKSKRAHSLHHSKKQNPHQASTTSSASSGDKKPTGKLPKKKPQQSDSATPLPSNWDRYSEYLDSEDTPGASPSQLEVVAPKSKGADYAHLISEAKGQAQANYPSDVFPFSDDNIYNFTQDFGPMLAVKGQNILSWIADDSFEFEHKPGPNLEAPFLSLNLNALAEQLAKAKLSERLFIEADVLPLELLDDESPAFSDSKLDPETYTSVPADPTKDLQQYREPPLPHISTSKNFPVQTAEEGTNSMKQIVDKELQSDGSINYAAGNPSTFEAASAEAELDMLLNSFTETKIFESPSGASSARISSVPAESKQKGKLITKNATETTDIDSAIDNLLEETSGVTETDGSRGLHGVNAGPDVSSTVHPSSKSNFLDDFDSWLDTI